ncbi:hypothetical protein ACFVH0_00695 [Streptomyces sp. NPDC127117]|uniref:hypothetical protein n=1 Tax=Streptomyces sp. NPDC127117 TaxID=3345368 RepID=UPI003642D164
MDSTTGGFTDGGGQVIGRRTDVLAGQIEHKLRLGGGAAPAHADSLIVPEGWRGLDVRIEGDPVVTEDGHENLSADEVAARTARFAGWQHRHRPRVHWVTGFFSAVLA